jgi:hypothetical protein
LRFFSCQLKSPQVLQSPYRTFCALSLERPSYFPYVLVRLDTKEKGKNLFKKCKYYVLGFSLFNVSDLTGSLHLEILYFWVLRFCKSPNPPVFFLLWRSGKIKRCWQGKHIAFPLTSFAVTVIGTGCDLKFPSIAIVTSVLYSQITFPYPLNRKIFTISVFSF